MKGLARYTAIGILTTLLVSCSGTDNTPDPKKWIEIAAKDKDPRYRLHQLYANSVLPPKDAYDAFTIAEEFAKNALSSEDTGYLINTVDFPSFQPSYVEDFGGTVQKGTGNLFRNYRVKTHFDVNNVYGAKTRLEVNLPAQRAGLLTAKTKQIKLLRTFLLLPMISDIFLDHLRGHFVAHTTSKITIFPELATP